MHISKFSFVGLYFLEQAAPEGRYRRFLGRLYQSGKAQMSCSLSFIVNEKSEVDPGRSYTRLHLSVRANQRALLGGHTTLRTP